VPKSKLGSANGFANVGGFLATFVMMYLTGLVIDLLFNPATDSSRYNLESFRWGFAAQFIVIAIGVTFFTLETKRANKLATV
jgi:hypothetical protein